MSETDEVKGMPLLAAGQSGAAFLDGNKIRWAIALDRVNRFGGLIDLPPGVSRSEVVRLACDRNVLTVVTKDGRIFVWSHNHGVWIASTSLLGEATQ